VYTRWGKVHSYENEERNTRKILEEAEKRYFNEGEEFDEDEESIDNSIIYNEKEGCFTTSGFFDYDIEFSDSDD
jgi:hypothetical protein